MNHTAPGPTRPPARGGEHMTRKILILSAIAITLGALAATNAGWTWDHATRTTTGTGFFDGN